MRGDRPTGGTGGPGAPKAPPHARGSPHGRHGRARGAEGSPACAGIAPRSSSRTATRAWLPRMRGDRPPETIIRELRRLAPPHARGSPAAVGGRPADGRGSPACAGIAPSPPRCSEPSGRLPRMRGDRPRPRSSRARRTAAPPHARGSPRQAGGDRVGARGSPACAGIAPVGSGARRARWWLPRMRGDRPFGPEQMVAVHRAPPHARGSPRRWVAAIQDLVGSPACAGIAPKGRTGSAARSRLPRMRGDRPWLHDLYWRLAGAPPHARGSPLGRRHRVGLLPGSPACAGIAPSRGTPRRSSQRLPRMRGDRPCDLGAEGEQARAPPHARGSPHGTCALHRSPSGSPACAGIAPRVPEAAPERSRLPRMRGDRPLEISDRVAVTSAPPHARGSPLVRLRVDAGDLGSPACAGIAPQPSGGQRDREGLPRMRGDRPQRPTVGETSIPAPPHARGSPAHRCALIEPVPGSPACAGIAPSPEYRVASVSGSPACAGIAPAGPRARVARVGSPACAGIAPWTEPGYSAPSGSPACAGIAPRPCGTSRAATGLPRMRGDRPPKHLREIYVYGAPPHARGSPPGEGARRPRPEGSPACAGIAPDRRARPAAARWLPRMRGDRPFDLRE